MRRPMGFLPVLAAIFLLSAIGVSAGRLTIEQVHDAWQGWPSPVSITADSLGFQPGRFDFVVAIDGAADGLIAVDPGQMVEDCSWEYFNYRVIPDTSAAYDLANGTQLIAITGVASPSGPVQACYGPDDPMELATIRLWNSHYRDFECNFVPIRFFWRDCQDNTVTNAAGDTAHVANWLIDLVDDSAHTLAIPFPGFGLPDDTCQVPGLETSRDLVYFNGGIDFVCADSVWSGAGDINLNGRAFEMADIVLFADFFMYGLDVFTINPPAQIAATDVNADGIVLSIPDLIFMLRLISGDNIVNPKPSPSAARATMSLENQSDGTVLSITSHAPIGAAYFRLVTNDGSSIAADPMVSDLACGKIGDTTTVLLTDFSSLNVLDAGSHELVRLDRNDITIADIEVYDTEGRRIQTDVAGTRPEQFELFQNYPNPFNPETNISFRLHDRARWTLTILNTLGQTVKTFEGTDAGAVDVIWHGDNTAGGSVSSGVYYYRLETQGQTATRPMVLLR